jgi:hypothetical protein
LVIVRYSDLRILCRLRPSPRNRANPRPSYAKDETAWGEKEFKQNNVREAVLEYAQENVHFKTKSNPDPQ